MYTNADMTIYNKRYDKTLGKDLHNRTIIRDVFFEETLGSNRVKSGNEKSDKALIFIPLRQLQGFVRPEDYNGSTNTFTFQIGDRVVKNAVSYDIIAMPSELDRQFETFTIHSVDIKDFGSPNMQHIELGLK